MASRPEKRKRSCDGSDSDATNANRRRRAGAATRYALVAPSTPPSAATATAAAHPTVPPLGNCPSCGATVTVAPKVFLGYEDDNVWKANANATEWIRDVVSGEYITMGNTAEKRGLGVRMLQLKEPLTQDDGASGTHQHIHMHGAGCYDAVLELFNAGKDTHALVVGNPGMGKSRQLVYFIHHILKPVVDHNKKNARNKRSAVVLLEHRKEGCMYCFSKGLSECVVPARRVVPAQAENLQEDVIRERVLAVGGLPRYVLSNALYQDRLNSATKALSNVSTKTLVNLLSQPGGNLEASGDVKELPAHLLRYDIMTEVAFREHPAHSSEPVWVRYYFLNAELKFLCPGVVERLCDHGWRTVVQVAQAGGGPLVGGMFQSMVTKYFTQRLSADAYMGAEGKLLTVCKLSSDSAPEKKKKKSFRVGGYSISANQRTAAENVAEVLNLARTENGENHQQNDWKRCKAHKTLVVSPVPNQPLWDFADAHNKMFQVTITATHGLNGPAVLILVAALNNGKNLTQKELLEHLGQLPEDKVVKLHVIFVCPAERGVMQRQSLQGLSGKHPWLHKFVEQYRMDFDV